MNEKTCDTCNGDAWDKDGNACGTCGGNGTVGG